MYIRKIMVTIYSNIIYPGGKEPKKKKGPNGTKATNTSSFYFYKFNSNEYLSSPEIINYIRDLN